MRVNLKSGALSILDLSVKFQYHLNIFRSYSNIVALAVSSSYLSYVCVFFPQLTPVYQSGFRVLQRNRTNRIYTYLSIHLSIIYPSIYHLERERDRDREADLKELAYVILGADKPEIHRAGQQAGHSVSVAIFKQCSFLSRKPQSMFFKPFD